MSAPAAPELGRAAFRTGLRLLAGSLVLSLLLMALALQFPRAFALDVGGRLQPTGDGRAIAPAYDAPFIPGAHAPEPARGTLSASTSETFRWTRPEALLQLPAYSAQPILVRLRLYLPPPANGSQPTLGATSGRELWSGAQPAGWRVVRFVLPGRADGDVRLTLRASPFSAPPDPRELGVAIDTLRLQPLGAAPWLPLPLLGTLGGILLAMALAGRLAGVAPEPLALLLLALGATGTLALLLQPAALTTFAPILLLLLLAGLLLLLLLWGAARLAAGPRYAEHADELRLVAALVALGFVVRLGGLLHPQYRYSDLLMHVHNLEDLAGRGAVLFLETLPCEAGLGRAPYPPAFYLLLAPLLALVDDHVLLMQAGTALSDALIIGALWAIVRAGGGSRPAALFGPTLYLAPPPLLQSLGIGEMANVGGQALALLVVALIAARRWSLPALCGLVAVALLGHLGVAFSFTLLAGCWCLALIARGQAAEGRRLLLACLAGGLLALAIFYSGFVGEADLRPNIPAEWNCPPVDTLGAKLGRVGGALLQPWSLTPLLLVLAGLAGSWLARRQAPRLFTLLLAWWLATLLSLGTVLFSTQTVRWQHFLFPALAAGGGVLLSTLWQRGRWWRLAALGLALAVVAYGLAFWVRHVAIYNH